MNRVFINPRSRDELLKSSSWAIDSLKKVNTKFVIRFILFLVLFFSFCISTGYAKQNADELYKNGKFAEAEKAYTREDMDHPKDIRYRYNRGCAAYKDSNYKNAAAAFSSVLRRTQAREVRFKAAYNLANTEYKQKDFASAVEYFKEALRYNPQSLDARYNLELALRELEKAKKQKRSEKGGNSEGKPSKPQDKKGNEKEHSGKKDKKEEHKQTSDSHDQAKQSKNKEEKKTGSENKDQAKKGTRHREGKTSDLDQKPSQEQGSMHQDESPKDLSGKLEAANPAPQDKNDTVGNSVPLSMIDKKKAEALLDNIKEDRSKYFRFQLPGKRKDRVSSGKDW